MQQPKGDNTVSMQPEFIEHAQINRAMEQMFQAMSTMMMQPIKCNGNYLAESLFQLICNKDARYDIHHC